MLSFRSLFISSCVFLSLLVAFPQTTVAQQTPIEFGEPEELEIGGLEVSGVFFSDPNAIKSVSGLKVGQTIKLLAVISPAP